MSVRHLTTVWGFMADCFCGCGREIKRRHWLCHSANVAGRDAGEALARLGEAQAFIEEQDPFRGDPATLIADFIEPLRERGQHYSRELQSVAHGETSPFGLGHFKAWLKEVRGMTGFILASPGQQQLIRHLGSGSRGKYGP
jgi:hypothetical protein